MSVINDKIMKLERERDELAAQFAEMASLADSLTYASSEAEADEIVQKIAGLVHDEGGALARRDARMKAEALEEASRKFNEAHYGNAEVGFDDDLLEAEDMVAELAAEYRKQAEGES